MSNFKSSLLLLGFAVILNKTNSAGGSELELTNVKLASLDENNGRVEHNGEEQNPLSQQDTKCDGNSSCWNGGTCDNGVCKCLPGTKGNFCEVVEGCENPQERERRCGQPDKVYCVYNATSQKPYCRCKDLNLLYDPHYKTCKECECGYKGNCSFVKGKKKCDCEDGYGLRFEGNSEDYCVFCGCGMYSDGCTAYGYSKRICNCKPGFSQNDFNRCIECDCGPNGNCTTDWRGDKQCKCEKGYTEKDGICKKCDCGENGDCGWDDTTGEKKCNCKKGRGVQNGVCAECNCYMGNDLINCVFTNGERKCSCPEGYEENNNSTCIDINECLNETACPANSDCKNTEGSYECTCKAGFRPTRESTNTTDNPNKDESSTSNPALDPKVVGCEDIDECVESDICKHSETTTCLNTPGSYKCFCKEGFSIPSYEKSAENGCRKNEPQKSWTTVYVVLCVVLGILLLGGLAYFAMRKFRR